MFYGEIRQIIPEVSLLTLLNWSTGKQCTLWADNFLLCVQLKTSRHFTDRIIQDIRNT